MRRGRRLKDHRQRRDAPSPPPPAQPAAIPSFSPAPRSLHAPAAIIKMSSAGRSQPRRPLAEKRGDSPPAPSFSCRRTKAGDQHASMSVGWRHGKPVPLRYAPLPAFIRETRRGLSSPRPLRPPFHFSATVQQNSGPVCEVGRGRRAGRRSSKPRRVSPCGPPSLPARPSDRSRCATSARIMGPRRPDRRPSPVDGPFCESGTRPMAARWISAASRLTASRRC